MFNYSVDTILLGNFATVNSNIKDVLEVGVNNGALSIFFSERKKDMKIDAIEIQSKAIEIAKMNLELNKKTDQIFLIEADFNQYSTNKKYDLIICNPPFYKVDASIRRDGCDELYIATHEVKLSLEQLIKKSSSLLKQKGFLSIVIPTERMIDAIEYMRKYKFEPKRIQMIHPRENVKSNLVLIEGRFRAGWGTHFLKNIYLHTQDKTKHEYREETKKLYKPLKQGEKYEY